MFKVRQFQVFGRLGMKTLNVRLVIVTRLDKMAPIDYLINKKCVYQHTCAGNFWLRDNRERVFGCSNNSKARKESLLLP